MNKSLYLFFTFIFFDATAQDTLCYSETNRFSNEKEYFLSFDNIIPSYTREWLYHLEKNREKKEVHIKIYKKNDTLVRKLPKEYYNSTIATDEKGNPIIIKYWSHQTLGIGKLCFLDSMLRITREIELKSNSVLETTQDSPFYENIRYVRVEQKEIILVTSPEGFSTVYSIDFATLDLHKHKFDRNPYLYDWGYNVGSKIKVDDPEAFYIHEGRIYYYKDRDVRTKVGNISSTYLNSVTLFIKGGFVAQIDNGDIIFFKFCD